MAFKPWYDSTDLINAVKRKISFPIYQTTFSNEDILAFANEEMMISQVPSILQFHEEYFVFSVDVPLISGQSRYQIPDRAIGMKLRDISYVDTNDNIFEMTRISSEDKSFFARNISNSTNVHKFYIEGNDIVLTPTITSSPNGSIRMFIFLRPNQLVATDRAATIQNFKMTLTIQNNGTIIADQSNLVINNASFVATSGAPVNINDFQIGVDATATATNLSVAITNSSLGSTFSAQSSGNVVTISSTNKVIDLSFSDTTSYLKSVNQELLCTGAIPSNIVAGSIIDLLQTKPGHRTYKYDVTIPTGGVSGSSIFIVDTDLPRNMLVNDYVCLANECIIPQIPPDLHNGLAERTCARILEALGDQQGLAATMTKLQDIEQRQGTILDDRVEGSPQKINARHSMLRYLGVGSRRRL